MDAAKAKLLTKFTGINTVEDPTRLNPTLLNYEYLYPIVQGNNVDIDNSYAISSRSGYTSVKAGTDIHSLWSDGTVCFYVDSQTLYELKTDYAVSSIRADMAVKSRVSYAKMNDRYYYMNGHQSGYIKNSASTELSNPDILDSTNVFKKTLPVGQLIETYRGCLYVASRDTLYVGEPLAEHYDIREGYRRFASRIMMVRAVDEGIYVSDSERTFFLKGRGNEDFERIDADESPAVSMTDIVMPASYMDPKLDGNVAMWTSKKGICVGDNDGKVINLTEMRYPVGDYGQGHGFVRDINNVRHYINSLY